MIYDIVHTTRYRFHQPVTFGLHRLLFRPRDGHDMRVLATDLQVGSGDGPLPSSIDLLHDVYGNSIAHIRPQGEASELQVRSTFTVEHLGSGAFGLPAPDEGLWMPPAYPSAERLALMPFLLPSYPDPALRLRAWAQQFVSAGSGPREVVAQMTQAIRERFVYAARDAEGTQTPLQTLELGSGACRDFATLMIDALRHLGIAARFVSGYLYVPAHDGIVGGGATHAWVQCYLSDCGWFPADPTNNLIGGSDLIRVAVGREASEVVPLAGSWFGPADASAGMTVEVSVTQRA